MQRGAGAAGASARRPHRRPRADRVACRRHPQQSARSCEPTAIAPLRRQTSATDARRRVEQRHVDEAGVAQRVGERLRHHADAVAGGDADDQLLDARGRRRRRRARRRSGAGRPRSRRVQPPCGAARRARRLAAQVRDVQRASRARAGARPASTATRRSSNTTCDSSVGSANGRRTTATSTLPSASAPGPSPHASEREVELDLRVRVAEVAHEARRREHGGGVEADPQAALLAARLRDSSSASVSRVERQHAAPAAQQRLAGRGQLPRCARCAAGARRRAGARRCGSPC